MMVSLLSRMAPDPARATGVQKVDNHYRGGEGSGTSLKNHSFKFFLIRPTNTIANATNKQQNACEQVDMLLLPSRIRARKKDSLRPNQILNRL